PLDVHWLGGFGRGLQPEVGWDRVFERRLRAASVLAASRSVDGLEADAGAAAPVAGDRSERGEARVAAVRRDADAVDAGAADDGDAPAAIGSGAQHGERVVGDRRTTGPARRVDRATDLLLLGRKVDAGEQHLRHLRDPSVAADDLGLLARLVEEPLELGDAAVDAE